MAEPRRRGDASLDRPLDRRRRRAWGRSSDDDASGRIAESIARFLGTPSFIIWLTVFCVAWLIWNTVAAEELRFDSAARGFTALTLMLSLQASYAAPLILLAQNRQTDRDRVAAEQDRQRTERNLADTEFLAREMASLRLALQDVATRDYVRGELRDLLEELREEVRAEVGAEVRAALRGEAPKPAPEPRRKKKRKPTPSLPAAAKAQAQASDPPSASDAVVPRLDPVPEPTTVGDAT